MRPHLLVPGRPNSAVRLLPAAPLVRPATVMIGPMIPAGCHSVISGMSRLIAGGMIIALLGLLRLGLSGLGMATDHGTGHQSDSIAVSADDLDHPALLAPRMRAIDGTVALARDPGVFTKGKQTSQCLVGHLETCRRCRSLCWKRSIGTIAHIVTIVNTGANFS